MKKSIKDFKELSWDVTEAEYRKDPALSYSILAKYERGGFDAIPTLFEPVSSPSLTFGSAVDSVITDGIDNFNERFSIGTFEEPEPQITEMVNYLASIKGTACPTLASMPDSVIINATEELKYRPGWKPETRAKVIREKGESYYRELIKCAGRTVLSKEMADKVFKSVDALRNSDATKFYFGTPDTDSVKRYYQLKFRGSLKDLKPGKSDLPFNAQEIPFRCMADLIIVNHEEKTVYPIDLKTSSHKEWEFFQSFREWSYQIQARAYWRLIRDAMDKDPFYKKYKLADYTFIVVNKETLTPLCWEFPDTKKTGTLVYGKYHNIIMRDPYEIADELTYYLQHKEVKVPIGISQDLMPNNLVLFLNK